MAEVKHRSRLYFQFPVQPSAKLEAQLAQAMGSSDAACVLLCGDGRATDEDYASRLINIVQSHGLACLVENDIALAERLGADGVHLGADTDIYRSARKRLGDSANIGVNCGLSRHDAMALAELGADYVAFDASAGAGIDHVNQYAELVAWWAEIFVVPCVAWNVDRAREAGQLAALRADFIAPSPGIWREDNPQQLIAEIDSAVRQA